MNKLLQCPTCKTYTLQKQCLQCQKETIQAHYTHPELPLANHKTFIRR